MRLPKRVVAASLVLVLVLAACGNSKKSLSASSGKVTAEDTEKPKVAGEAHRNDFKKLDVPGVTDKEINYSVVATKTGNILGTCLLDCYLDGIKAYFAYRNSQGGIYGRKLKVNQVLDDELGQNQARSLDVVSGNKSFGNFQAALLATGWGDLDQAGIPTYVWGINATEAANRTHIFPSLVARCESCALPSVPWVAKQKGAKRAASLGYGVSENSKVCAQTIEEAFKRYEKDSGVKVVYENDNLDYGLKNGIGPEVTAMKKAGVDFISTCIDLNGMKSLAQELHRQGMDDVVLYHPNSYDQGAIKAAGPLFEGDVVGATFRPFESDGKGTGLDEYKKWMAKQGSKPSELSMTGWINAATAYEGLLEAGPDFDREKVTAATNRIHDWTADGLLEPIDWSLAHTPVKEDDPRPANDRTCAALVVVKNGKFVPMVSAEKPWECWKAGKKVDFNPTSVNFQ